MAIIMEQAEVARHLAFSIRDETSYQRARFNAIHLGLRNAELMPEKYDKIFVQCWQVTIDWALKERRQVSEILFPQPAIEGES